MPSTRRKPNTVASQATAGAMRICEPMPAVESQAPSSKLSPNAPRRSGRPTVVSRLSKLARNEPSSTAATANSGCGAMPPREIGPWPAASFAAIRALRVDAGDDRHARHEPRQQRLVVIELDAHGNALHHLGEIAGGVVGRQQRDLRTGRRRDALDLAAELFARKTVDGDLDRLARCYVRELGLLVIRDHIDLWQRHHVDEVGADVDVVAGLHLTLADDAIERRRDLSITKLELHARQRRLGGVELGGALLPGALQDFELMLLGCDHGAACAHVGLRLG